MTQGPQKYVRNPGQMLEKSWKKVEKKKKNEKNANSCKKLIRELHRKCEKMEVAPN